MKISGKSVITLTLFLVAFPVVIDLALSGLLPKKKAEDFSMTKFLFSGYGRFIPLYLGYLLIAFAVIYLLKKRKKTK